MTQYGNDVGPYIPGNGQLLGCCSAGPGYDFASGWGSLNVASFAGIALQDQPAIVSVGLGLAPGQRPVAGHRILANVSCTGRCVIGAFAVLTIGHSRPFTVYSNVFHLAGAGTKSIPVPFSSAQLAALRAGLRRHRRITAAVRGAIVDAGGNIERQTAPITVVING